MDTKGREELLGMVTCQSYQGCAVCTHSWSPGALAGKRQCICDGYRRFLSSTSRARQKEFTYKGHRYQYRNVEERAKPVTRDDEFVRKAVSLATERKSFAGHKTAPLPARWSGYSWWSMNVPDLMHDMKNLCDTIVRILVGKTSDGYTGWSKDAAHRKQSETLGVFPTIWPDAGGELP